MDPRALAAAALLASVVQTCRGAVAPDDVDGAHGDGATADGRGSSGPTAEAVVLTTSDGWTLSGSYYGASGDGVVLLVHQLSSSRDEWAPLIERLSKDRDGPSVLALDLRGHGRSTRAPSGPQTWQDFGNDPARWAGVALDVRAGVELLRRKRAADKLVVVGSSIGSSAVLLEAAGDPAVGALVLLSPGLSYRGLDTIEPFGRYLASGRDVLLVASEGDASSAAAVRQLGGADAGSGVEALVFHDGAAHGVSMAGPGAHPELWDTLRRWIRAHTAPTRPREIAPTQGPRRIP